jgi:hypothetical protein
MWQFLIVVLTCAFAKAQQFQKAPVDYKTIHFKYEQKANCTINDEGFFADTLLFKLHFPEIKFSKVRNPKDASQIYGHAPLNKFGKDAQKKLLGFLYHVNEKYDAYYDRKRNITRIYAVRHDEETADIFKKYFKSSYSIFKYEIRIDYTKKLIDHTFPMTSYSKTFNEAGRHIQFQTDDKMYGLYKVKNLYQELTNLVIMNPELDNKISLGEIFLNADSGATKIITADSLIELKSVSYE